MTLTGRIIGVDESGKGDFFGPLVVAAFLADDSQLPQLQKLGIKDSKKLSDKRALELAGELRKYPHAVVVIGPEKYNQLYEKIRNLNKLLAWGHARCIENVLQENEADLAVSDKFGKPELIERNLFEKGRTVKLEQIVRGEAIMQVAAASIIARATFLNELKRLSAIAGHQLLKGATSPVDDAARQIVREKGVAILDKIAKKHFKNYMRATNPTLFQK